MNTKSRYYTLLAFIAFWGALSCSLLPFWPHANELALLKYLALFSPRWIILIPLCMLLFIWRKYSQLGKAFLALAFVFSFIYLNINIASEAPSPKISNTNEIKLITLNVGGGSDLALITGMIEQHTPDIILFQEGRPSKLAPLFANERWQFMCNFGLCIASRLPFNYLNSLSREQLIGWGDYAAFYEFLIEDTSFHIANVHLITPRAAIAGALKFNFDNSLAVEIERDRQLQASILSQWLTEREAGIVAGDFNMPNDENVYKKYFGQFNSALKMFSSGFNHTKHTSWHGIGIDHIIANSNITFLSAQTLPSTGGDHRAVLTKFKVN